MIPKSSARNEMSGLLLSMQYLARAKAQQDRTEVWWALDEIAAHALMATTPSVRERARREIERHREQYRTADCTDRFCALDVLWDLRPEPFPAIEPANANDAPRLKRTPRSFARFETADGTVFHSDDFGGDTDATLTAFLIHVGKIDPGEL